MFLLAPQLSGCSQGRGMMAAAAMRMGQTPLLHQPEVHSLDCLSSIYAPAVSYWKQKQQSLLSRDQRQMQILLQRQRRCGLLFAFVAPLAAHSQPWGHQYLQ